MTIIYLTGGQTALALRLLLAVFSSKISSDVNRPFGDEVSDCIKSFEVDKLLEVKLEKAVIMIMSSQLIFFFSKNL